MLLGYPKAVNYLLKPYKQAKNGTWVPDTTTEYTTLLEMSTILPYLLSFFIGALIDFRPIKTIKKHKTYTIIPLLLLCLLLAFYSTLLAESLPLKRAEMAFNFYWCFIAVLAVCVQLVLLIWPITLLPELPRPRSLALVFFGNVFGEMITFNLFSIAYQPSVLESAEAGVEGSRRLLGGFGEQGEGGGGERALVIGHSLFGTGMFVFSLLALITVFCMDGGAEERRSVDCGDEGRLVILSRLFSSRFFLKFFFFVIFSFSAFLGVDDFLDELSLTQSLTLKREVLGVDLLAKFLVVIVLFCTVRCISKGVLMKRFLAYNVFLVIGIIYKMWILYSSGFLFASKAQKTPKNAQNFKNYFFDQSSDFVIFSQWVIAAGFVELGKFGVVMIWGYFSLVSEGRVSGCILGLYCSLASFVQYGVYYVLSGARHLKYKVFGILFVAGILFMLTWGWADFFDFLGFDE